MIGENEFALNKRKNIHRRQEGPGPVDVPTFGNRSSHAVSNSSSHEPKLSSSASLRITGINQQPPHLWSTTRESTCWAHAFVNSMPSSASSCSAAHVISRSGGAVHTNLCGLLRFCPAPQLHIQQRSVVAGQGQIVGLSFRARGKQPSD